MAKNSVNNSTRTRGLKPFKPGQSGNLRGRPKTDPEIKALFKGATPEAAKYLISLIGNPKARPADRIKAAEVIIDHGIGKAAQEIQVTGERNFNIVFDPILKEELGAAPEAN
jgi:hypothetical protein